MKNYCDHCDYSNRILVDCIAIVRMLFNLFSCIIHKDISRFSNDFNLTESDCIIKICLLIGV